MLLDPGVKWEEWRRGGREEEKGETRETADWRTWSDSSGCIGVCSVITCDASVRFDFAEFNVGIGLEVVEVIEQEKG